MAKQLQYRRLVLLALLLVVAFAGLGYRLVDLQLLRNKELSDKARGNTHKEFLLEPRRGDILDAKGNLLATSAFVKTVFADPALIGNRQAEVARAVAPLLQMSEGELQQRLTPRVTRNTNGTMTTNSYVVLKRKVQVETWQKIQMAMTNLTFGLDEKNLPRREREFYRDLRRGRSRSSRWTTNYGYIRTKPWQRTFWDMSGWTSENSTADGCWKLRAKTASSGASTPSWPACAAGG